MKKRLITSALPYVNNVPHLGNLIQVLSADVFARFCRSRGYETLYVCGTDEYGTATETKALEEKITPRELCDRFHALHRDIYKWFNIEFDKFGRTSSPVQTEITQELFLDLEKNGLIVEVHSQQLFCVSCDRFLADRYIRGTCPKCGHEDARGDQCEVCGALLEPTELKEPRCVTCSSRPELRDTKHLHIDLPKIRPQLEAWMKEASERGFWANNALRMTEAWIRDGLKQRAITRDLKWGIPVPRAGYEKKVFYVWFDAPIGYISITADLARERGFDYKTWWQNPDEVELYQFIGKDNIPFHTVIFPSTLLGSGKKWTMLHHIASSEYLNYEAGKFSKSKGIGVFGTDAMETGIDSDIWRFYIFYNRPENADYIFTWQDFKEKVNKELIGNLGNLVNRTSSFLQRASNGQVPQTSATNDASVNFWREVKALETEATNKLEAAGLRDGLRTILNIADLANKRFQESEPWKDATLAGQDTQILLRDLCAVLRDLAILIEPYMPAAAEKIARALGFSVIGSARKNWSELGQPSTIKKIETTGVLFKKLDDDFIEAQRIKYSGSQAERADEEKKNNVTQTKVTAPAKPKEKKVFIAPFAELTQRERFKKLLDLRVAKIIKIERHPQAEKLYIETLDDGSGTERVIVSGLVPYYKEEELLGKHIVLANNLKAAKLRGVESRGMLLAAAKKSTNEKGEAVKETVEVLDAGNIAPGTRLLLAGQDTQVLPDEIDVDTFFSVPLTMHNFVFQVDGTKILLNGSELHSKIVSDGEVG